jgi:hypothetical protein
MAFRAFSSTKRAGIACQLGEKNELKAARRFSLLKMLIVFVVTSRAWAQAAYGVPSQNYCQPTDFSGNSYAPQNDTSAGGNGSTRLSLTTLRWPRTTMSSASTGSASIQPGNSGTDRAVDRGILSR